MKGVSKMKQLFITVISISIIIASDTHPNKIDAIFKYYQNKYQIYNLDDLNRSKLKTRSNNFHSSTERDPSQLIGNWEGQDREMGLYITVGTDQVAPTMGSINGFEPADGSLTITHDEFTTELTYMSIGSIFGNRNNNRNAGALQHAQDYVDSAATLQGQSPFDLLEEFDLSYFTDDSIVGGLGGDDPENCEINWPDDPYQMAVYSFVSEYVLNEGASVGCFTDDMSLDQTYAYVALEIEEQWSESGGGDDGDDGGPEYMFMNFDIMNLFLIMFGMVPEGVEYPTLLVLSIEEEDVMVMALVFVPEGSYISFDSENITIDDENLEFSFNDLMMVDSAGTTLNVDGIIGPSMYELLAGVETEIPLPSILFDSVSTDGDWYLSLNDDGTGTDIEILEVEDYYYETYIDTNISYFIWNATDDSVFITYLNDEGSIIEDDNISVAYSFNEDTLLFSQTIDPCTDPYYYYYESYDECFENTDIGMYAMGVYDIQDFHQEMVSHLTLIDAVVISDEDNIPVDYKLYSPYPNPFNPVTTLGYDLLEDGFVNITIYDMMGRVVSNLVSSWQNAGYKSIQWNAINSAGQPVSAGVYLYTIQADFRP